MIAVIFEVVPHAGRTESYLAQAAALYHHLAEMPGFVSVERFESIATPGKYLSLSFWRNEEALASWRTLHEHRAAQQRGRTVDFSDYRLRVASVVRDYGMNEREQAPADSVLFHAACRLPSPEREPN